MALNRRLLLSGALLLALLGGAAALAAWQHQPPGGAGEHAVEIIGPEGPLFSGVVEVEQATALSALVAAADAAGLALTLEEYPGMGTYVRAVGPYRAEGSSGWIYEVRPEGGEWILGDRSAALYPLQPGDAVRWRWTSDGT